MPPCRSTAHLALAGLLDSVRYRRLRHQHEAWRRRHLAQSAGALPWLAGDRGAAGLGHNIRPRNRRRRLRRADAAMLVARRAGRYHSMLDWPLNDLRVRRCWSPAPRHSKQIRGRPDDRSSNRAKVDAPDRRPTCYQGTEVAGWVGRACATAHDAERPDLAACARPSKCPAERWHPGRQRERAVRRGKRSRRVPMKILRRRRSARCSWVVARRGRSRSARAGLADQHGECASNARRRRTPRSTTTAGWLGSKKLAFDAIAAAELETPCSASCAGRRAVAPASRNPGRVVFARALPRR